MTIPTFQAGAIVEANQLPSELQPNEQEIQESFAATGTAPVYAVPQISDIQATEAALESVLGDIGRLTAAREAIVRANGKLSNKSARILRAATECMCEKPAVQVPEAFATGEDGAGQFAIENIDRSKGRMLKRITDLLKKWARQIWLWVQSLFDPSKKNHLMLNEIKNALPKVRSIYLNDRDGNWNGFNVLPAAMLEADDSKKAIDYIDTAFIELSLSVTGFTDTATSMFDRVVDGHSWRGLEATNSLERWVNRNKVINAKAIGGRMLQLTSAPVINASGVKGFMFSAEESTADSYDPNGEVTQQKLQQIHTALEKCVKAQDADAKTLQGLARSLEHIADKTSDTTGDDVDGTDVAAVMTVMTVIRDVINYSSTVYNRAIRDLHKTVINPKYHKR